MLSKTNDDANLPAGLQPEELPAVTSRLRGASVLLMHADAFIASYIHSVLCAAGAIVVGPAITAREGRELIATTARIDAAVIDYDLSGEDSHVLADELARDAMPSMFVRAFATGGASIFLRGRPTLIWPFAAYQVCDTLARLMADRHDS